MSVGEMTMGVHQRRVLMPMGMRLPCCQPWRVLMLMMLVVVMAVLVGRWIVPVLVRMVLR